MTPRHITAPEELVSSWEANEITAWDAIAVVLHRVDASNAAAWVLALPLDLQAQLVEDVTAWGPGQEETVELGRGAGLEERTSARAALRAWLGVGDRPERWLSPAIVARIQMEEGQPLPQRFVARAVAPEGEWLVRVERVPGSPTAWVAAPPGADVADGRDLAGTLALHVAGQHVGSLEIVLNARRPQDAGVLDSTSAPPRGARLVA